MITVSEATTAGPVNGRYDKRFEKVAEEFVRNFEQRGEVGASVCINIEGETVVDMWGGMRDPETGDRWQEDTLSIVFSCTKAATALCAHMLIERGQLDPNAKVTDYWPEFGQNGKENTTVLMMLNHSAALPALRETVKPGGYNDWDYMVERLAAESPFWEPGTRNGYHMITYGWTVGELVRRVSGKSLGTFFKDEVAGPLGIDFWIGLPEDKEPRVANMIPFAPDASAIPTDFLKALLSDPDSIQYLSFLNSGGHQVDSREAHAAEIGGGGGVANGRALAGMFNPLANDGKAGSVELLSADTIKRISAVSMATQCDATLLIPTRFAQGFMVSMDNRARPTGDQETALLGRDAFGHVGAGGSIGFADPECRMGFGYSMTQMGAGLMLNERGQSVVDAAYKSVGYRTNAPGFWVR
ncbi:MAG: serine hydrolase domain-containing protein [Oceanicoccus sp.]